MEPPSKRLRPEDAPTVTSGVEPQGLAEFSRMLSVFTHFGSLQVGVTNTYDTLSGLLACSGNAWGCNATQMSLQLSWGCWGGMQVVAQVPRASARQSSAILSSIEFDRDAQLFATAGVSKRICVFDFANVMRNPLQVIYSADLNP